MISSFVIFAAAVLVAPSVLGETVPSKNFDVYYACPTTETAENAYLTACPATSKSGYALSGVSSQASYDNAPKSYKLGTYDLTLDCVYTDPATSTTSQCYYAGGGGAAMIHTGTAQAECPDPPTNQPQPSPGVNYRKRSSISERDLPASKYACVWGSNDAGYYDIVSQNLNGYRAQAFDPSYEYYYHCKIQAPADTILCDYSYDETNGLVPVASNDPYCPITMCQAVDGQGNNVQRRRALDKEPAYISRQVNTRKLRSRLASN